MRPIKIFLDIDDVLNTCTPAILNYVGCDVNPTDYGVYKKEWGYDIVKAAHLLLRHHNFSSRDFWRRIKRHHWAEIPTSNEFTLLINLSIKSVGCGNVHLLTKPTDDPDCLAGKLEWIKKNCPIFVRQYHMTSHKENCAKPDCLLIDDNEDNVRQFQTAGGQALLFPRPWNSLHGIKDNKAYLEKWFNHIFGENCTRMCDERCTHIIRQIKNCVGCPKAGGK